MSLLEITTKREETAVPTKSVSCQLLYVHFYYGIEQVDPLKSLEKEITNALSKAEIGELHETDLSPGNEEGYLMIIGDNAENMFDHLRPIFESSYFMDRSIVTLRTGHFGNPAATEKDYCIRFSKLNNN